MYIYIAEDNRKDTNDKYRNKIFANGGQKEVGPQTLLCVQYSILASLAHRKTTFSAQHVVQLSNETTFGQWDMSRYEINHLLFLKLPCSILV